MHDCSRSKGCLMFACCTLVQASVLHMVRCGTSTAGATVSVGPLHQKQTLPAGCFVSEPALKRYQVYLGIRFAGHGYSFNLNALIEFLMFTELRQ